ncbi:hypothetical protein F183_A44610 [Bryobacterales bacterium F-183]|nr:hypothetical protein F183_A44610 [Bryobacterales bacterium F-183]
MLLAHRYPDRILSLTSVEGNFTLNDAFMTSRIAAMSDLEADALLQQRRETPEAWLQSQGIDPLPGRIELARHWLNKQNGRTIVAMSRSVLNVTGHPSYLDKVREVFASPVPVHLIAGERSRAGWDVPDWALHEAASMTILPATGHMMMLEDPAAFAAAVRANVF